MANDMHITELETYRALYNNQGARIEFNCDQVTYQGIISSIIPDIRLVKLRHTKVVEGDKYFGNLRFRFKDLASFKVIESADKVNRYPRNEYLMNILKNSRPVTTDTILKVLFDDKLSDDDESEENSEDKIEEKFVLDLPKDLEDKLPKNYAVIDTVDDDFYEAIQSISCQQLIGVSFHGTVISRFGKLTWICISTDVYLFLFDIQKLEKEAFDKGLRQIFENKSIKKIIHDCSKPSDCLAHIYTTHLTNVFDTRVADYVVHMQCYNDKYEFRPFSSLDCCLRNYLRIPQDFLFNEQTSQSNSCRENVFSKRPISNDCLHDLLKSAVYLKLLQEKLSEELLAPLYRASNFYSTVIARSSQQIIDLLGDMLSRPDRMIHSILMHGIQTVRFEKPQHKVVSLSCAYINPQTGKAVQPNLGFAAGMRNFLAQNGKRQGISALSNKESIINEKCNEHINFGIEKVNKPYLGSPTAVKNAVLSDIVKKKKSSMADKKNSGKVTSSAEPGFIHVNKIYYHTSISDMYPGGLQNLENLKPITYVSKFSSKLPLSYYDSSLSSPVNVSDEEVDRDPYVSSISGNCSSSKEDSNGSFDIWSKLRSEFLAEEDAASHYKERKISFVPG